MRNRTITTIVVFIFILTNILFLYDAFASCGVNDDEERNKKLNEAMEVTPPMGVGNFKRFQLSASKR